MRDIAWTVDDVLITTRGGRHSRVGLVRNGIGLDERDTKRGEPQWAVTHLATGLQVCMLEGALHDILPVATDIADCAQWAADGFTVDAALAVAVREIGRRSDGRFYRNRDEIDGGIQ